MQMEVHPQSQGDRLVIFDLYNVISEDVRGSGWEGPEWAGACQLGWSLWARESVSSLVAVMTTMNLKCTPPSYLPAHSSCRAVEDERGM